MVSPVRKRNKKTFEKSGVKVSQQRHQCFKTDEFKINSKTNSSDWHQLLISGNGDRWQPAGVNKWFRE